MRFLKFFIFFSPAVLWAQPPGTNTCSSLSLQPGTAFPLPGLEFGFFPVPGTLGSNIPFKSGIPTALGVVGAFNEAKWKSLARKVPCQGLIFHLPFPSLPDLLFLHFLLPTFPLVFPVSSQGSHRSFNEGFNCSPAGWGGGSWLCLFCICRSKLLCGSTGLDPCLWGGLRRV